MIPILFDPDEQSFADERRALVDATGCTVRQDAEARDELALSYPLGGAHFEQIGYNSLILAAPNPYTRPQPYRVYAISRPVSGLVSFSARHLAYDGLGIPVAPFTATSASDAAAKLKSGALVACPFTLETDIEGSGAMTADRPESLRALVATADNSWLHTYGGGLEFDRWTIRLRQSPGADRDVTIRYGVDLVDLRQEESIAEVYTGVLPYWSGAQESGAPIVVYGAVCQAPGTHPVQRVQLLDLSSAFEGAPTSAQLTALGEEYVTRHEVGVPRVSLTMRYADIGQDVRLHDTVGVDFVRLGVSTRAPISAVTYDVLHEICTGVEIGTLRRQITDSLGDASRLKRGTLPSGSIGARSVSEKALAAYAVTKGKLAALSVTTPKLGAKAVTTDKTSDGINDSLYKADVAALKLNGAAMISSIFVTYGSFSNLTAAAMTFNGRGVRLATVGGVDKVLVADQ